MKNKKTLAIYTSTAIVLALGIIQIANLTILGLQKSAEFINNPLGDTLDFQTIDISPMLKEKKARVYAYNDLVDEETILSEMNSLADRFDINANKWEEVLRCEATCRDDYCEKGKLDNLAKNPVSTALGLCQYTIGTWQETESFKQSRKARTDYKACLWEMALDIVGGESWRWQECLDIKGFNSIK